MKPNQRPRRSGVTLTELLVVLLVVSLMATIAVPVYTNQSENARISVAMAECKEIADAEEACALVHGFYVPIQMLDDIAEQSGTSANTDSIDNEPSDIALIDYRKGINSLNINQPRLSQASTDVRVNQLRNRWGGPFLNPNRVFTGGAANQNPVNLGTLNQRDHPLDPWGNPYRFYTPAGRVGSRSDSNSPGDWANSNFGDGQISPTDDPFDRYAIVSYGPNGERDSSGVDKDDIIYFFGKTFAPLNETGFVP